MHRVLEDGLGRLGEVRASDTGTARQALATILDGKVQFTPIALEPNTRTYRFEANLTLGRILGATQQNNGDVPNGSQLEPASRLAAGDGSAQAGRGRVSDRLAPPATSRSESGPFPTARRDWNHRQRSPQPADTVE